MCLTGITKTRKSLYLTLNIFRHVWNTEFARWVLDNHTHKLNENFIGLDFFAEEAGRDFIIFVLMAFTYEDKDI